MKIHFLGTGGGLCSPSDNYHSNMVFISHGPAGEDRYLGFDCGVTWQMAMEAAGYSKDMKWIDGFFISHLHDDHAGCLGTVGFKRYFGTFPFGKDKPKLFMNAEIADEIWNKYLSAAMESVQDKRNNLDQYFDVERIKPNGSFTWCGTGFDLIQTVHVVDDRRIKQSYGLIFNTNGKTVFITGDTQFAPNQLLTFYQRSNVIFQDCELATYPNSVHAQYRELVGLSKEIKSKMYLYHNDGARPDAKADGFAGFVNKGDIFDISEINNGR